MPPPSFITRVRLKNYKSIGSCDVDLQQLTFLAGPNGSGKSNFLDGLRFVSEGLRNSLDHAIRERGGINEVRRRSTGHPTHFSMRLDFRLSDRQTGWYSFEVGAQPEGGFIVRQEQCVLSHPGGKLSFRVEDGKVIDMSARVYPPAASDRLYLVNAAGLPEFRPVYDALSRMGFYNLSPDRIRALQSPDSGDLLLRDGGNISSVFAQLSKRDPQAKMRIEKFLSSIVPGVKGAERTQLGHMETIRFQQDVSGSDSPWKFHALNMSDGTLRAFSVLVALFQFGLAPGIQHRLVGIEEPEIALHPAASQVLFDALMDASERVQVIVTSHSPELLDHKDLPVESILAVLSQEGETQIAPVDEAARTTLREHLASAGELLRAGRLTPDPERLKDIRRSGQLQMFEDSGQ